MELPMSPSANLTERLKLLNRPQAAAQALRDAILVGQLRPGDRIVENHWAATLGVGQPTIREALRELEYQGMLVKHPNRGTFVAQLSVEDYRQLIDVRMPLEKMAVGMATGHLTEEDQKELESLVEGMAASINRHDLTGFHERDVAFHRKIWEIAGNPYLAMCLEAVTFRLFVFSVIGDRPRLHEENLAAVEQHRKILAGLCSRDPETAQRDFVESTIGYWHQHYGVTLEEEAGSDQNVAGPPTST
jgi:DNA-binding GntR family transcriptional regulator